MKKRVLSLVLTICMVLTLMPTVALAEDMTPLYIGSNTGVILPDNDKYTYGGNEGGAGVTVDTLADIPEDATWYLHRDDTLAPKYTLTLKDFDYSGAGYIKTDYGIGIYAEVDLTIELMGDNSVTQAGGSLASFGIYVSNTLTIQGSGSLSATGGNVTDNDNNSHGIYAYDGNITIKDNAQVTATGGSSYKDSYGLAGKSVSIEGNAQVTAVAGTATNSEIGIHGGTEGFTATGGTTSTKTYINNNNCLKTRLLKQ